MIDKAELGNIYKITTNMYAMPVGYRRNAEYMGSIADLIFKVYSYREFLSYVVTKYAQRSCAVIVNNGEYTKEELVERFKQGQLNYYDVYMPVLFGNSLGHVDVTDNYIIKTLMVLPETKRCIIKTKEQLIDELANTHEFSKRLYDRKRMNLVGDTKQLLREYLNSTGNYSDIYVLFDGNEFTIIGQHKNNYYRIESDIRNIKELIPCIEAMRRNRASFEFFNNLQEIIQLSQNYEIFPVSLF